MAYTSLPTVSAGDYWTAANHNTYIKNNFDFIATTRNIMLLPNPAVATTNASDAFPRPTFVSGALVYSAGTTSIDSANNHMLYATSATNMAAWHFVLPPDFISFEEAQVFYDAADGNVGNYDLELVIGQTGKTGNLFSEVISSTSIPTGDGLTTKQVRRWDVDITGCEYTTDKEDWQFTCILARYGDSTDDTSNDNMKIYGINLVYKFYTT